MSEVSRFSENRVFGRRWPSCLTAIVAAAHGLYIVEHDGCERDPELRTNEISFALDHRSRAFGAVEFNRDRLAG
jgi:hypothetical protein